MIRGLLFDLDGTLVDSLPGIAAALNLALVDHDLATFTQEEVTEFIGNGAQVLAEKALGSRKDELGPALLEGFQKHYKEAWKSGTTIYPSMGDLIEKAQQQGLKIGVLSNKPHAYTQEIVHALFGTDLFDPVEGHREEFPKKPDPTTALLIAEKWGLKPEEVAYVGDSTVDLATARAAQMLPAIVTWGYGTPDDCPLSHSMDELASFLGLH
ncbi:MAG: HAD-IA family hydrolase [Akkermansiaceae bacterium]